MPQASSPRQFFVPFSAKIADITEADVLRHELTLANPAGTGVLTGETRTVVAVILMAPLRIAGAGNLYFYPNEGANNIFTAPADPRPTMLIVIAAGTQRLQYALGVAGNDFDLYCVGYVVEA